jgi:hypothetical protein
VFLLNSRRTLFTAAPSGYEPYRGAPSPEVTEPICRVPERAFSRAPLDIVLVYLCRFEVRFPRILLRGFSWQGGIHEFGPYGPPLRLSDSSPADLPTGDALRASTAQAIGLIM